MKNRILFAGECCEKTTKLTLELRKMIVEHGFVEGKLLGGSLPMHVNVGTEDEPIWAAFRVGQVFIRFGDDDAAASWMKLEEIEEMDESTLVRLQQYKLLLGAVNSNATGSYLFDNLRNAAEFFLENYEEVGEKSFRDFAHRLFEMRTFSRSENGVAQEMAESFLEAFFSQRQLGSDNPFTAAWNSILPSRNESNYVFISACGYGIKNYIMEG
jgi:hypothetical protein